MLTAKSELRPFRSHIFRSFVAFSTVIVCGAAFLIFATNKLTEDWVLSRQLSALAEGSHDKSSGIFTGRLDAMPEPYRQRFATLNVGLSELEVDGKEVQVLRTGSGKTSDFAAIVLPDDSSSSFFVSLLLLVGAGALLLAYAVSKRLAHRFSMPLERIALGLGKGQPPDSTPAEEHLAVNEFVLLQNKVGEFQREQALLVEREVSFARNASHELRTPLTIIEGALELLSDADDEALRAERHNRIRRAASNMRLTAETLLALARAEQRVLASNGEFESELNVVIEQQRELLDRPVTLRTRAAGHPQATAQWCSLVVALQTLIENAVRHTNASLVTIETSPYKASVTDTGQGMSRALSEQLLSGSAKRGGLGYPLVRLIRVDSGQCRHSFRCPPTQCRVANRLACK